MPAVQRQIVAVHMDSRNRTGFLMDGIVRLLGDGPDLHSAPKPAGVTLSTLLLIHLDYFHSILLEPSIPLVAG
jgi:hypothetical protein